MIEKIDAGTAIRLLDAGKAVAVDVREPDEYAVGHIPGAKLLPLGEVNSRAAEVLPEKKRPGWSTAARAAAARRRCRSWTRWATATCMIWAAS